MRVMHDEHGREIVDDRPVEMPLGFKRPESLTEQIQRLVRGHLSRVAEQAGFESFEEAEDFDVEDDDIEPRTPFETEFDPVLGREVSPDMIQRDEARYRKEYVERARRDPALDEAEEREARRGFFKRFSRKRSADRDGPSPEDRPSRSADRGSADGFGQDDEPEVK